MKSAAYTCEFDAELAIKGMVKNIMVSF